MSLLVYLLRVFCWYLHAGRDPWHLGRLHLNWTNNYCKLYIMQCKLSWFLVYIFVVRWHVHRGFFVGNQAREWLECHIGWLDWCGGYYGFEDWLAFLDMLLTSCKLVMCGLSGRSKQCWKLKERLPKAKTKMWRPFAWPIFSLKISFINFLIVVPDNTWNSR